MGAWGAGIFESDDDWDITSEISNAAGMNLDRPDDPQSGKGLDSTVKALNEGLFTKLFEKYHQPDEAWQFWSNKHYIVILVSLGMQLGVNISQEQKSYARSIVKSAGLYKEGIIQFQKALDEYVNGTAYVFEPSGVCEMIEPRNGGTILLNHLAPRYYRDDVPTQDLARTMIEIFRMEKECYGCGRNEFSLPDGQKLKQCVRCKAAKYCGKQCQKRDWKRHKKVCAQLADEKAQGEGDKKDDTSGPQAAA